jgi:hypothetical protein
MRCSWIWVLLFFASILTLAPGNAQDAWLPFEPSPSSVSDSRIDLRWMNEAYAGEQGWIQAKDGQFVHGTTGTPVRFWAVNGPPHELSGNELTRCAQLLARYGVNMVRIHGAIFDQRGEVDLKKIDHIHEVIAAMKQEGIYTHLSIYFPLWFKPPADLDWMPGYDGNQHPFAALMIHPGFQAKYREWLRALLTHPSAATGKPITEEPAVFGFEIQNEDSLFFWTFTEKNIPDPVLHLLEKQFGDWLVAKYGSLDAAMQRWEGLALPRDNRPDGRIAFRPLWNIANERKPRDLDTAQFLFETQSHFYQTTYDHVRGLGFRGLIHASNWTTASPERLGPLEKWSYTVGDFIDRHGYFECHHQGDNAAWSIRKEHTYRDRSALRFEANEPEKPRGFTHPIMDPHYDDKPSMISETTFTRPNRFRSEAPLYFASYGALQDTDAIVHFALDGIGWNVKPNYFMQQWTLATPAMMGQFPASALIYRQGLVQTGPLVADVRLNRDDTLKLKGTSLPQDASLDELRAKDLPTGGQTTADRRIDPLLHYVGRTRVRFSDGPSEAKIAPRPNQGSTIESATRELTLDYDRGMLVINSPKAQGVSGALNDSQGGKPHALSDISIASAMELGHIVVVSLDGEPIASSKKMLLQVMSEEQASDFQTESLKQGEKKIMNIGKDPWLFRELSGSVVFRDSVLATPLDGDGRPKSSAIEGNTIELQPDVLYYLVQRREM